MAQKKLKPREAGLLLEKAITIAVGAHRGQKDKNGDPYILHPLRLMLRARTAEEKMVAVLHDVVEDSDWTIARLRKKGFPADILRALDHLTKRDGEEYEPFVERAIADPLARGVKILDLEDNMNPLRLARIDEKAAKRLRRYVRAWRRIMEGRWPTD
jgi:(p)ppGpp synthase/HD superfamily hydrolase